MAMMIAKDGQQTVVANRDITGKIAQAQDGKAPL
jgi:hypothetical protein